MIIVRLRTTATSSTGPDGAVIISFTQPHRQRPITGMSRATRLESEDQADESDDGRTAVRLVHVPAEASRKRCASSRRPQAEPQPCIR
jgi:hypothetical protein